jgi:hypothetical protein
MSQNPGFLSGRKESRRPSRLPRKTRAREVLSFWLDRAALISDDTDPKSSVEERNMKSETELWSLDPGNGHAIQATATIDEATEMSLLDMRWDDGKPVPFPIRLTDGDVQNLLDLLIEHAGKNGIKLTLPKLATLTD